MTFSFKYVHFIFQNLSTESQTFSSNHIVNIWSKNKAFFLKMFKKCNSSFFVKQKYNDFVLIIL